MDGRASTSDDARQSHGSRHDLRGDVPGCSTWQYEVVGHLVEQHRKGQRLGYLTGEAYAALRRSERRRRDRRRGASGACSSRTRASRHSPGALGPDRRSRFTPFETCGRGLLPHAQAGRNIQRTAPAGNDPPDPGQRPVLEGAAQGLVQRYEELVADPVTAVVQLARHLGLGVTRREATEIAEEYSLESNKTRIEALRHRLEEAGIDLTVRRSSDLRSRHAPALESSAAGRVGLVGSRGHTPGARDARSDCAGPGSRPTATSRRPTAMSQAGRARVPTSRSTSRAVRPGAWPGRPLPACDRGSLPAAAGSSSAAGDSGSDAGRRRGLAGDRAERYRSRRLRIRRSARATLAQPVRSPLPRKLIVDLDPLIHLALARCTISSWRPITWRRATGCGDIPGAASGRTRRPGRLA